MPGFILYRDHALSEEEWGRLPSGCEVVTDGSDMVARAEVDGPLMELLHFSAALARAVPDARLVIRQNPAVLDVSGSAPKVEAMETLPALSDGQAQTPPPGGDQEIPADPALIREDPWELLDKGELARAEQRFRMGYELDMVGRDRVRDMFNSTDPATSAMGARLSGYTNWKSFVTTLRRGLEHADVRVRRDCVTAIGKLAGPALVPAIEERLRDPSPEVQQAAREALKGIASREPVSRRR